MSRHFTYEIDERNLRMQLKDLELPCDEEAWQKFSTYSNAQKIKSQEHRFSKVNISLSRNVLIPAVFVAIILLFSFLLFNFITINNPVKQEAPNQVHETPSGVIASKPASGIQEPKQQTALPASVESASLNTSQTATQVPANQSAVVINSVIANGDTNTQKQVSQITSPADSTKQTATKKHHKRHNSEVLETEQLRDIRPTLVADDQETDVRPN